MSDILDDLIDDALGIEPEPSHPNTIGSQSRDGLIIFDPPDEANELESGYADEAKIRPTKPGTLQLQLDGDVDLPYYQAFWVAEKRGREEREWLEFDSYEVFRFFLLRKLGHDVHAVEQAIALLHNYRLVDVDLKTRGSYSHRGFDRVGTFM